MMCFLDSTKSCKWCETRIQTVSICKLNLWATTFGTLVTQLTSRSVWNPIQSLIRRSKLPRSRAWIKPRCSIRRWKVSLAMVRLLTWEIQTQCATKAKHVTLSTMARSSLIALSPRTSCPTTRFWDVMVHQTILSTHSVARSSFVMRLNASSIC